jgi:hypothetical protein
LDQNGDFAGLQDAEPTPGFSNTLCPGATFGGAAAVEGDHVVCEMLCPGKAAETGIVPIDANKACEEAAKNLPTPTPTPIPLIDGLPGDLPRGDGPPQN